MFSCIFSFFLGGRGVNALLAPRLLRLHVWVLLKCDEGYEPWPIVCKCGRIISWPIVYNLNKIPMVLQKIFPGDVFSLSWCCMRLCNDRHAIFGKVGTVASDEVVLELFRKKCLPVLLYGTEVCPMKKSHIASLQFVVNSCFASFILILVQFLIKSQNGHKNFQTIYYVRTTICPTR